MPILAKETDLYPLDLFDRADTESLDTDQENSWWAIYTLSRREKELMRRLLTLEIPFYCPIIPQRQRSPNGRMRTSFIPMFSNYAFIYGDATMRYEALTTNCVARDFVVSDGVQLTRDLRQIHDLIEIGAPLTRESRLTAGTRVRVKTGPFRNYEGIIIRREGKTRLLVSVNFLQQGASVLLDDCEVDPWLV
jgi:transcriptional antiterminator RfaH